MKRIAVIVGHNSKSQGAYSKELQTTEYMYYMKVVERLKELLGDKIDVYFRKPNSSYGAEMREVLARLNKIDYDYVLELHFNSASSSEIQGCECIAFYKSVKGLELAKNFNELISRDMNIKNRGIIKVNNSNQRGAYGIMKAKAPYVLVEPFFGSNAKAKDFSVDKMTNLLIQFIERNGAVC